MVLLKFKNESDSESDYKKVEKKKRKRKVRNNEEVHQMAKRLSHQNIFFFDWNEIESPFDILPMEMKTMIFIYLDPEDITQFGKCSKSCQKLFKLFRPKIKRVSYRGSGIGRLEQSLNCLMHIEFHKYPENIYEIEVGTLNSINCEEIEKTCSTKLWKTNEMIESGRIFVETMGSIKTRKCRSSITLKKSTKTSRPTNQAVKILSTQTKPKCHRKIALEMFKNMIEFNKSSIEEISIEASTNESNYMRSIDIYSENLKKLKIDGYFSNHPQLDKFLSIENLEMKNFNLCEKHLPMIKSNYLRIHKTVMGKRLYKQFLKNWRDGLMENLREVSMIGDENEWFRYLLIDYTMFKFLMGENGEFLEIRNHAVRIVLVCSPSVNFKIRGVVIDHNHNLPVRMILQRLDL